MADFKYRIVVKKQTNETVYWHKRTFDSYKKACEEIKKMNNLSKHYECWIKQV